ncbi:DUF1656 domain-containing protein [Arhodomonas aquaeolei]|uniref:DUF1656 domain-containing protein n=1 Tax=Arhodomonas aquaeolei TaxID=2369 RepID=UPI000375BB55|nr:DUF1656 domain-containing protein [Arhodomonas aquaeolei]
MGLREIAIGGIFISPLLVYLLLGFIVTVCLRLLLHRLAGHGAPWQEAWFDAALFVIATAAVAYLGAPAPGSG